MELPFMATEKILMACVEKGRSRQAIHEVIKRHSVAAGKVVKEEGKANDLLERLADDMEIPFTHEELVELVGNGEDFAGRAESQTEWFLREIVEPRLAHYPELLENTLEVSLAV